MKREKGREMITSIITALVAAQLKAAQLQMQVEALEARPPEVVTEYVTEYVEVPVYVETVRTEYIESENQANDFVECGMCGAHVAEYYMTTSDADGELFEACRDCYELKGAAS